MNRRTKIKFKDFECNLLVNGMNEFRNMLVVISMGTFILHSIENKTWYHIKREHRYSSEFGLFGCCIILLTRSNKMLLYFLFELGYILIANCNEHFKTTTQKEECQWERY